MTIRWMPAWAGEQRSTVAKVRVYELAKEFGVESKSVMAELEKMGEFVRSASSTIEAPVVRRLKEQFSGGAKRGGGPGSGAPSGVGDARPERDLDEHRDWRAGAGFGQRVGQTERIESFDHCERPGCNFCLVGLKMPDEMPGDGAEIGKSGLLG